MNRDQIPGPINSGVRKVTNSQSAGMNEQFLIFARKLFSVAPNMHKTSGPGGPLTSSGWLFPPQTILVIRSENIISIHVQWILICLLFSCVCYMKSKSSPCFSCPLAWSFVRQIIARRGLDRLILCGFTPLFFFPVSSIAFFFISGLHNWSICRSTSAKNIKQAYAGKQEEEGEDGGGDDQGD